MMKYVQIGMNECEKRSKKTLWNYAFKSARSRMKSTVSRVHASRVLQPVCLHSYGSQLHKMDYK